MKWHGSIGYGITEEDPNRPGIWVTKIIERNYCGDKTSDRRNRIGNNVNDDLNIAVTLSIIADPFAYVNCSYMLYADIRGTKWKITSVDDTQYPRLILTIGGVYNGQAD